MTEAVISLVPHEDGPAAVRLVVLHTPAPRMVRLSAAREITSPVCLARCGGSGSAPALIVLHAEVLAPSEIPTPVDATKLLYSGLSFRESVTIGVTWQDRYRASNANCKHDWC